MDHVLRTMTFEFFGAGKHKIEMEKLLTMNDAVFLDVRSYPEVESLQLKLEHHIEVLYIPLDEIQTTSAISPVTERSASSAVPAPDSPLYTHFYARRDTKTCASS